MRKGEYGKMFELEDRHFWFIGKRWFVESIFGRVVKKKQLKILDIGCGTGGMTKWMGKYGKVVGVEENKTALEYARKRGLKIHRGNASRLPFSNNLFDLVTIFDVLYHKNVDDDVKVLKEAFRVLKNDGWLVITDSALPWIYGEHDRVMQARERYDLKNLVKKIEEVGFIVVRKSYIFFSLFPAILLRRLLRINKNEKSDVNDLNPVLNFLLKLILKVEAFFLKWISYPIGTSLILLVRKE